MLLHKKICFFSDSLYFCLLHLFHCVYFVIFFRSRFENCGEISCAEIVHLTKLIQSLTAKRRLFDYLFFLDGFIWLWITILNRFFTVQLMRRPMFFLTILATIINLFTPSTNKQLLFFFLTKLTFLTNIDNLSHLCFKYFLYSNYNSNSLRQIFIFRL